MIMDPIQKAKTNDPNEDGTRMAHEMASGLGIPAGTSMWEYPKKPLGKPQGAKGQGKGQARPTRSHQSRARGHVRGHTPRKQKSPDFSGSWD